MDKTEPKTSGTHLNLRPIRLEKLLVTSRDSVSWRGSGDLLLIPVFSLPFLPRMQIFDYPLNELHRSLTHLVPLLTAL